MSEKYDVTNFDLLSEALRVSRLRGRVYCYYEFSSPWALSLPSNKSAYFHVVERGGCWLKIDDDKPLTLATGDLILILKGEAHLLYDDPQATPLELSEFLRRESGNRIVKHGGGGAVSHLVCGEFVFEKTTGNPVFSLLPPVIHLQSSERAHDWLEITLRQLSFEARHARPGSEAVISRLTDIIFVQAIREWITGQPSQQSGWLGAMRDEQIGKSLELMHQHPQANWSVARLAKEIGMSRSKFADVFRRLVGETPLGYLTKWRMQIAARLLSEGNLTVAETAGRVGYQSETSFSKVFKQQFGDSPSVFRRKNKTNKQN